MRTRFQLPEAFNRPLVEEQRYSTRREDDDKELCLLRSIFPPAALHNYGSRGGMSCVANNDISYEQ